MTDMAKEVVDNMNGITAKENKKLHKWIVRNYGQKCPDRCKNCVLCEAWKSYDKLKLKSFKYVPHKEIKHDD